MKSFWQDKRVLVTGHTGFKGSWLTLWLWHLGAKVTGLSLEPETTPALFTQLNLAAEIDHHIGDIRDAARVKTLVEQTQPDVVLHLAAQPLVRRSYVQPLDTWDTNVMGTIHVLEALKPCTQACAAVFITTDKCYENREWVYGYREHDPLGGHDPYSSSKAAAELAIASWRNSFFEKPHGCVAIASARAGNVIGGGDWAEDRIVPDAMRSLSRQQPIPVRNPRATRPWQHVLEPLGGYLLLAQRLYEGLEQPTAADHSLRGAFNFGPALASNRPVKDLVEQILSHWPGTWLDQSDPQAVHEAKLLNLVTDKAFHTLGWQPAWGFERTLKETVSWYRQADQLSASDVEAFRQLTLHQIQQYQADIKAGQSAIAAGA
ncbi:CDP-glucose 4,6-dehydratase [Almyronema epifaneia]|uniref:CDP-glucose 4,6-dehydratase n=1 Tax=Almyronema epifaneia S1 TaxID=2991925 RepID=A0ABW6IAU1_9CYAN